MEVALRFVNRSHDRGRSEVVLFQKNAATDMDQFALAWKTIRYCGYGCYHPLAYPLDFQVSVSDGNGNHSPRITAVDGQSLAVTATPSGRRLAVQGSGVSPTEVEVLNALDKGAININIFRGGRLLARKTSVAPQQKAVFRFQPTLWIGVASQVVQGEPLSSAVMSSIDTELSLLGVAAADILMTGGGGGEDATPFAFSLGNIVRA